MYMDLYAVAITLQEADRWLQTGYTERAEARIRLAYDELMKFIEKQKEIEDREQ